MKKDWQAGIDMEEARASFERAKGYLQECNDLVTELFGVKPETTVCPVDGWPKHGEHREVNGVWQRRARTGRLPSWTPCEKGMDQP